MRDRGSHHSLPCAEGQAWSERPVHGLGSPFEAAQKGNAMEASSVTGLRSLVSGPEAM